MKNIKYFFIKNFLVYIFIFEILFLAFYFSKPVLGHVLKTDGSVGAVLHVSPDDDPVVGVPVDFFFEFKDRNGLFIPENCDCVAVIKQNGEEQYTQALFETSTKPSLEDASFTYIFDRKNVYQVQVKGEPIKKGDFEPFQLSWDVRVERESTEKASSKDPSNWFTDMLPSLFILAGASLFVGLMMSRRKR